MGDSPAGQVSCQAAEPPAESLDSFAAEPAPPIRVEHETQEGNAGCAGLDLCFPVMEDEAQAREEPLDLPTNVVQSRLAVVESAEVVGIADVSAHPELLLDEVVERVELDVGEELAREVADGEPPGPDESEQVVAGKERPGELALEDIAASSEDARDQVESAPAAHGPGDRGEEDLEIDGGEETHDVAPEAGAVASHEAMGAIQRGVCPLALAARVRVVDEPALEQRLQDADERVMDHAVTEGCGRDEAGLRNVNAEGAVAPRLVGAREQRVAEAVEAVLQLVVEGDRPRRCAVRPPRPIVGPPQVLEGGDPLEEGARALCHMPRLVLARPYSRITG